MNLLQQLTWKFTYTQVKHDTKWRALFLVMWTVKLINYCWPMYTIPALRAISIVCNAMQMAKAPSWQPTMDKCKANAWSTTNELATMVAGKFTYTKVKQIESKGIVPFPCHVYCKRQSLTIVSLCTSLRATSIVAILQVPDGKDSG